MGWALGIRAAIAGIRGNMREAAELASASIEVMRSIDHRWGVARAQLGLGDLARLRGDLGGAQRMYADALGYLREIGARPEIARCLSGLGRVALDLGDTAAAREYLAESLRVSRDIGARIGMARGLESFAALADREGDTERAVMLAAASAGLRATSGLPPLPGARAAGTSPRPPPRRRAGPRGCGRAAWPCPRGRHRPGDRDRPARAARGARGRPLGVRRPTAPSGLTPREAEIAALIADGRSNKAIAAELVISPATAARHVANIMSSWASGPGRRSPPGSPTGKPTCRAARASLLVSSAGSAPTGPVHVAVRLLSKNCRDLEPRYGIEP